MAAVLIAGIAFATSTMCDAAQRQQQQQQQEQLVFSSSDSICPQRSNRVEDKEKKEREGIHWNITRTIISCCVIIGVLQKVDKSL